MEPAIVRGDTCATAYFIEDGNSDLVDVYFICTDCEAPSADALPWPCFEFSPDYTTHCERCRVVIHRKVS